MDQAGSGSGVWCRGSQGGGGRQGGALTTDDNAARRGARAREPGMIQTRGPSSCRRPRRGGGEPCGTGRPEPPRRPRAAARWTPPGREPLTA
ncbi:hypothetical protein CTZ28_14105 [Streptomyces shenzhenensis]|uniref:Uncharacterized protein n=1 Tax=Streptomyces shenzhenensis TaxID=943815 RepID=A0A3M0I7T3_9ACTN|nr:hypothetical protein CTZ28_14105 [Streptomyces shenzhenensis]